MHYAVIHVTCVLVGMWLYRSTGQAVAIAVNRTQGVLTSSLYTVHTAHNTRDRLHNIIYQHICIYVFRPFEH